MTKSISFWKEAKERSVETAMLEIRYKGRYLHLQMRATRADIRGKASIKARLAITEKDEAKANIPTKALATPMKARFSIGVSLFLNTFTATIIKNLGLDWLSMFFHSIRSERKMSSIVSGEVRFSLFGVQ